MFWLRLVQLQVLDGDYYQELIEDDRTVVRFVPARRGKNVDRWGVPMVDNRAVYHLALTLQHLELPSPQRYRVPFLRFDEAAIDGLLADLALRIALDPDEMRRLVRQQFQQFPAVGIRRVSHDQPMSPQVMVVPIAALLAEPEAPSSWIDQAGFTALLDSGFVQSHPLMALQQEIRLLDDPHALVVTPEHFTRLVHQLAEQYQQDPDLLYSVVWPFVQVLDCQIPAHGLSATTHHDQLSEHADEDAAAVYPSLQVVLIDQAMTDRMLPPLSRGLQISESAVRDSWQRLLSGFSSTVPAPEQIVEGFEAYTSVSATALQRAGQTLPVGLQWALLQIDGLPGSRQVEFVLQDDAPDVEDGLCVLFARRSATSLRYEADEIHRLLRQHGTATRLSQLRRRYRRTHQVVFDPVILPQFIQRLSRALRHRGVEESMLSIEQAITTVRRQTDRGWAGETHRDALPFIFDVDQHVAIDLQGLGAPAAFYSSTKQSKSANFANTESILPGLTIQTEMGRHYPHPGSASLITGWLSRLSAQMNRREALFYGLDPMGWVGSQGLEQVYDTTLQGVIGREVYLREHTGLRLLEHQGRRPQAGRNVMTTIDLELQIIAEQALQNYLPLAEALDLVPTGRKGEIARQASRVNHGKAGMVVMDCFSGEILALASTPQVDLNQIRRRYSEWADSQQSGKSFN